MRKRTKGREFALQILYQMDICHDTSEGVVLNFWQTSVDEEVPADVQGFASELVRGVVECVSDIDTKIMQYATNWHLERMAFVDRNVLRMGAYELLYRVDIPPKVSINEAVEIAKKYSGPEAGKFVNGILDKIKMERKF